MEREARIIQLAGQFKEHRIRGMDAVSNALVIDDQGYAEAAVNELYGCSIALQLICCALAGSAAIDLLVDPQEYHDHVQEALDSLYDGSMFDVNRFLWPVT